MPINAGALDTRITLSRRTLTRDTQSGQVASYTKYATVWAAKRDLHGSKRFQAQQFFAEQITEFTLRWRTDILMTDRITDIESGTVYEILQNSEIPRHQGHDILARAIKS